MDPLYKQAWFTALITWCRKFTWFERWVWGYSQNMEDFVRNPAEELRDNFPPFAFMDVKNPMSVFLIRFNFIPFAFEKEQEYFDDDGG